MVQGLKNCNFFSSIFYEIESESDTFDCFDEQSLISVSVIYLTCAEEIFIAHSCHYLASVIALLCPKPVQRMIVWDQLPLFSQSAKWKFLKVVTWGCTCLEKRDQRKPTPILGQSTFIHYLQDF